MSEERRDNILAVVAYVIITLIFVVVVSILVGLSVEIWRNILQG